METCELCGAGVVYRFNTRATPESAYVYICLGAAAHVHADPATLRSEARPVGTQLDRRQRILERRPLRAGGLVAAVQGAGRTAQSPTAPNSSPSR